MKLGAAPTRAAPFFANDALGLAICGWTQRAVRAPIVGQLLRGQANGFPGVAGTCSWVAHPVDRTAEIRTALCRTILACSPRMVSTPHPGGSYLPGQSGNCRRRYWYLIPRRSPASTIHRPMNSRLTQILERLWEFDSYR